VVCANGLRRVDLSTFFLKKIFMVLFLCWKSGKGVLGYPLSIKHKKRLFKDIKALNSRFKGLNIA
jgi:hypothetical protein